MPYFPKESPRQKEQQEKEHPPNSFHAWPSFTQGLVFKQEREDEIGGVGQSWHNRCVNRISFVTSIRELSTCARTQKEGCWFKSRHFDLMGRKFVLADSSRHLLEKPIHAAASQFR
jgi:hypothetical protein